MIAAPTPLDGPLFLVDSSVWQRVGRSREVRLALEDCASAGYLCVSAPIILELGFSAPDPSAWDRVMGDVGDLIELPLTGRTREVAAQLQGLLWHRGLVREVGVFDTLTAATALEHGATVIHYDRDFELLASVSPDFHQRWAVPPGSVP